MVTFYSNLIRRSSYIFNQTLYLKWSLFNKVRYTNQCTTNANKLLGNVLITQFSTNTILNFKKNENFSTRKKEKINQEYKDFDDDSSTDEKKKGNLYNISNLTVACVSTIFSLVIAYGVYFFGKPKSDEFGNPVEDEFSALPLVRQYIRRTLKELDYQINVMRRPYQDKLLPDPLQYPYLQPKYTLILEVSDLLVHPDWTYEFGWRYKKRPGVEQFLESVSLPTFELVLFSSERGIMSYPLLEALDPDGYALYKLARDSTEFSGGDYVKNLDCLNRDLSKVIVVDWNKRAIKFHPSNALIIPRWNGEDHDTTLIDLANLLRNLADSDVDDVREVLNYYSQFENPIEEFRENQKKYFEHLKKSEEQFKKSSLASQWSNSFMKTLNNVDIR